jgi:glycosyltransferase involved in cell wall biosynthesis
MAYTSSDIQIFITTYNRPVMALETLESVLKQSAPGATVIVLDNSPGEETAAALKPYLSKSAKYIKTETGKPFANILKAREMMKAEYSIIIHDDDIMHPRYIETLLAALNAQDNITLITTHPLSFYGEAKNIKMKPALEKRGYLFDSQEDFAASFWTNIGGMWTGTLCKSSVYKKADAFKLFEDYGKISDVIMLAEMAKIGKTLILKDTHALYYRRHSAQDLTNESTRISLKQFMNYIQYYRHLFMESGKRHLKNIYYLRAGQHIKGNFLNMLKKQDAAEYLWPQFAAMLKEKGLLDAKTIFFAKRRDNFFYRLLSLPMQLYYCKKPFVKNLIKF